MSRPPLPTTLPTSPAAYPFPPPRDLPPPREAPPAGEGVRTPGAAGATSPPGAPRPRPQGIHLPGFHLSLIHRPGVRRSGVRLPGARPLLSRPLLSRPSLRRPRIGRSGLRPRLGRDAGFTLLDLLLVLAILSLLALVSIPPLQRASAELRLRMAGEEVSRIFARARSFAVRHNARVAVKFHPPDALRGHPPGRSAPAARSGRTFWSLHVDGDGDGVRSRDVERGVDPPVPAPGGGRLQEARFARGILPGFPPGPLPRDPSGRRLTRRHDPIRFNRSDLASFGPVGTATPGSVYLTDGRDLAVVRITGRTGRVHVLLYRADEGRWR